MRNPVCTMLAATVLAAGFSFAEAAQKRKSSAGKSKTVDPIFRKISIPPGTVELAEQDSRKVATKRVVPDYPSIEKGKPVPQGDVKIVILVGEDGMVIDASAKNGHPHLARAALAAAKRWEFQPFMKDGHPVKFTGTLTFKFRRGS